MSNKLRIIGGDWRSRCINFIDAPGLRPTPVRVRETAFNWLRNDIMASQCLDLYAGSGALGFEAASRGAKLVTQVENNALACKALKENIIALGADQIRIIQADVFNYLIGESQCFDVVFIDPPFAMAFVVETCQLLENKGWLSEHAKIYVEAERSLKLEGIPKNWQQLKNKVAGEVGYYLFERVG